MPMRSTSEETRWLNPEVLQWARRWKGLSILEAAEYMKKPVEVIEAWESGEKIPTVKQARKLVSHYGRQFAELFLPNPPTPLLPDQLVDFRAHRDADFDMDAPPVRDIRLWAESQRATAIDLLGELDRKAKRVPLVNSATTRDSVKAASENARSHIGISLEDQLRLPKSKSLDFTSLIAERMESAGIMVLRSSDLSKYRIRGIALAETLLPVVVYTNESPTAQAFTLVHELGHLLLGDSSISGPIGSGYRDHKEERWCNRFAAAFLMPSELITSLAGSAPEKPLESMSDEALSELAGALRVSRHALAIRLVHLGYLADKFYWSTLKPQLEAEEDEYKGFGRPSYYGKRFRSRNGDILTGLVLDAWSDGIITGHNAAEALGFGNVRHLEDIRDRWHG